MADLQNQPSAKPTRKMALGVGGSGVVVMGITAILRHKFPDLIPLLDDPDVMGLLMLVCVWVGGYLTREAAPA